MLTQVYSAEYEDSAGRESIQILNDSEGLSTRIRGVEFGGPSFDLLEPAGEYDPSALSSFTLHNGELCSCRFEITFSAQLTSEDQTKDAKIYAQLQLTDPTHYGTIDTNLQLQLLADDLRVNSRGISGTFEDELLDLQAKLSKGTYLKTCVTCAFSDYHPGGWSFFGSLACFRDNKEGYAAVRGKYDLFSVWSSMTEYVPETYLCPEFARRVPGTGYRG